jgi:hypothetical protein
VQADILGYSWRAAYFIGGAPGIAVAVLLFFVQVWLGHHNIFLCNVNKFTSIFSYSGSEKTGREEERRKGHLYILNFEEVASNDFHCIFFNGKSLQIF